MVLAMLCLMIAVLDEIFLVPNEHRNGARMGQVVVVELQERSASFTQPVGIITEILGDNMAKGMEVEIALRNHDISSPIPKVRSKIR